MKLTRKPARIKLAMLTMMANQTRICSKINYVKGKWVNPTVHELYEERLAHLALHSTTLPEILFPGSSDL